MSQSVVGLEKEPVIWFDNNSFFSFFFFLITNHGKKPQIPLKFKMPMYYDHDIISNML